ncbi:MAG: D-aminoacyl-tRNA deacylase [Elusimicrobiota bacterium]
MKAVIQRVNRASVACGKDRRETGAGLMVLVAVGKYDTLEDIDFIVDRTVNLRIFSDDEGKLNLSVIDTGGEILAVPQFTLYGDCRKGRRPSFEKSAGRDKGEEYFNIYIDRLRDSGITVLTGFFGKEMTVELENNGPVTIVVENC